MENEIPNEVFSWAPLGRHSDSHLVAGKWLLSIIVSAANKNNCKSGLDFGNQSECPAEQMHEAVLRPFIETQTIVNTRLRNNNIPSQSNRTETAALVNFGHHHTSRYANEAARLKGVVDGLLAQIQHIESLIFSPVRKLPPDVLEIIFQFYVEDAGGCRLHFYDREIPPNILGSVCKYWRELTLSTLSLWTKVSIQFSYGESEPLLPENALDTVLSRSCRADGTRLLLDLTLYADCEREGGVQGTNISTFPTVMTLLRHLGRVRKLTVEAESQVFQEFAPLHWLLYGNLPALEHLVVDNHQHWEDDDDDSNNESFRMFEALPLLRTVEMRDSVLHFTFPLLHLDLLKCGLWSDSGLLECLDQYSEYSKTLRLVFHQVYTTKRSERSLVLNCRHLEIDVSDVSFLERQPFHYDLLSFPKLHSCKVFNHIKPEEQYHRSQFNFSMIYLQSWIHASGSQLRYLLIERVSLSGPLSRSVRLPAVLAGLTVLEELIVRDTGRKAKSPALLDGHFLEELNTYRKGGNKGQRLLPSLTTLELDISTSPDRFTASALEEMIRSRRRLDASVARLQKLTLSWDKAANIVESMRQIKERGLDVLIYERGKRLL